MRSVREQRRPRHARHRPAAAQFRLRAVGGLEAAAAATGVEARRAAGAQEQGVLQIRIIINDAKDSLKN
jgi:hypothetical protein